MLYDMLTVVLFICFMYLKKCGILDRLSIIVILIVMGSSRPKWLNRSDNIISNKHNFNTALVGIAVALHIAGERVPNRFIQTLQLDN